MAWFTDGEIRAISARYVNRALRDARYWKVRRDEEWALAWYGMGGGFGGHWYCTGCGNPQLGDPPWAGIGVRSRCRPCGPGPGYVACPATHGRERCGMCRGEGWVEELV